jgi:hypothetical protein
MAGYRYPPLLVRDSFPTTRRVRDAVSIMWIIRETRDTTGVSRRALSHLSCALEQRF